MPIDLAAVSWLYVIVLALLVFVATLIGNLLAFHHRMMAALLSALIFTGFFVFWSYYPHEQVPLPTSFTGQRTPVTVAVSPPAPAVPATPAAPAKPRNPVTEIPAPATPAR
jgi:hypothetical protein